MISSRRNVVADHISLWISLLLSTIPAISARSASVLARECLSLNEGRLLILISGAIARENPVHLCVARCDSSTAIHRLLVDTSRRPTVSAIGLSVSMAGLLGDAAR